MILHATPGFGESRTLPTYARPQGLLLVFLLGVLALLQQQGHAQIFIDGAPISAAANSVNTCEANPAGVFNVKWQATGPATNARITVKVPVGVSYLSATATSTVPPATTPSASTVTATQSGTLITFTLPTPLAINTTGSIDFKLTYTCNAIAGFTAPSIAALEFTPYSVENGSTNPKATVAIGNTMSIPVVQLNAGTNGAFTAGKRNVPYTRTFIVKQTGQRSKLYSYQVCFTYDANQTIASRTLSSGAATVTLPAHTAAAGAQQCLTIDQATYPALAWPFKSDASGDDSWTYSEQITPTACAPAYGTQVTAIYGCGTAACQPVANYNMTLSTDASLQPTASNSISVTANGNSCVTEGYTVLATHLLTGGEFTNLTLRTIADGQNTYLDRTSIEYRLGSTGAFTAVPSASLTSVTPRTGCSANGISDASFATGLNVNANTGTAAARTLEVRYRMLLCCPGGTGCATNLDQLLGTRHLLSAKDHCGADFSFTAQYDNRNISGSTSDQVPVYIANGQTSTWRHDINTLGNLNALPGNFQVCANFSVDPKLAVQTAGGLRWHDAAGTLVETAPITALAPAGSGDFQACFTNRFWRGGGSKLYYDVRYTCRPASPASTCGATVASSMKMGVRFGTATCAENTSGAGACVFAFMCESGADDPRGGVLRDDRLRWYRPHGRHRRADVLREVGRRQRWLPRRDHAARWRPH